MNFITDSQEIRLNCQHQSTHQFCNALTVMYVQMICSVAAFHGHHIPEHNLSWTKHGHILNNMLKKSLMFFLILSVVQYVPNTWRIEDRLTETWMTLLRLFLQFYRL